DHTTTWALTFRSLHLCTISRQFTVQSSRIGIRLWLLTLIRTSSRNCPNCDCLLSIFAQLDRNTLNMQKSVSKRMCKLACKQ
ncbi:hypothetical protein PMAYCL1PPCAC_32214, partial [Pristionchus mayeri]